MFLPIIRAKYIFFLKHLFPEVFKIFMESGEIEPNLDTTSVSHLYKYILSLPFDDQMVPNSNSPFDLHNIYFGLKVNNIFYF